MTIMCAFVDCVCVCKCMCSCAYVEGNCDKRKVSDEGRRGEEFSEERRGFQTMWGMRGERKY